RDAQAEHVPSGRDAVEGRQVHLVRDRPRRVGGQHVKAAGNERQRPTVAHVNYSFFHSTQSFIYFYLTRLARVRSICLTRDRESPAITAEVPPELDGNLFTYAGSNGRARGAVRQGGLRLRRGLGRLPPAVADPALGLLNRRVVPRMRPDADPD